MSRSRASMLVSGAGGGTFEFDSSAERIVRRDTRRLQPRRGSYGHENERLPNPGSPLSIADSAVLEPPSSTADRPANSNRNSWTADRAPRARRMARIAVVAVAHDSATNHRAEDSAKNRPDPTRAVLRDGSGSRITRGWQRRRT